MYFFIFTGNRDDIMNDILNDMIFRDHIIHFLLPAPWGVYWEILSLGAVLIRTLPGAGSVLDITIFEDHVIQYIIPIANEYQEIHPCSAVNIDSVKINTSLIMMKEWRFHL